MFKPEKHDDFLIIKLVESKSNSIDISNIEELKEVLNKAIEEGNKKILVDFSNITYIDSSGLGGLMDAMKQLKEKGGELGILSISKDVLEVFTATKVAQFFKFYKNINM